MEIRFEKTGSERKALVAAISEITGERQEYLAAPTFAFRVGGYVISRNGTVDTGDAGPADISSLLAVLAERGFVPVETPRQEESAVITTPDVMSIELPADGFTETAFDNLRKLIAGKAALIRMAVGNDLAVDAAELPAVHDGEKICFPWFRFGMVASKVDAWSCFFAALWATAKKQGRVTLRERALDEESSIKFLMRCFLLKIGFIGDRYKDARRIILDGLPGNGSRKKPAV